MFGKAGMTEHQLEAIVAEGRGMRFRNGRGAG